jgi:hypothetical protein
LGHFFITYGKFSEQIHELIDEIIETSDDNLTHIATASQANEQ